MTAAALLRSRRQMAPVPDMSRAHEYPRVSCFRLPEWKAVVAFTREPVKTSQDPHKKPAALPRTKKYFPEAVASVACFEASADGTSDDVSCKVGWRQTMLVATERRVTLCTEICRAEENFQRTMTSSYGVRMSVMPPCSAVLSVCALPQGRG
ncbi:unnamed protein product [Rangifer tarandus platyrhynchus]|uniref:Uncharacterized protein n=1 Tax=Rangifer tarandus platyrhynchus TaxID=3082113 RepID=A0ABN8XKF0_RANTA|nr:unnamed protein product [Rangifer tarandus platyrhynchus]